MINMNVSDFRRAITLAAMVPERRNTIPILSTLRCRANGSFEVAATDLDMTIAVTVPREAGEDAAFILNDFGFVAKSLAANGGKELAIVAKDGEPIVIESGPLEIKVKQYQHVDDWPAGHGVVHHETFSATLSPEHLRLIERVTGAVSTEETRYYLNGVYLHHLDGWNYRAIATDGHRLMFVDLALPDAKGELAGAIIPRKTVSVLLRALGKSRDPVRLAGGDGTHSNRETSTAPSRPDLLRIAFSGKIGKAEVTLSSKTIDGTYPDYTRVVPTGNDKTAVFKIADVRRAIESVARTESRVRAIKMDFKPDKCRFTSHFAEAGTDAGTEIPCDHDMRADGLTIGFNGQYLQDMLGALRGEEVVFSFSDSAGPVIIRDPADTAFTGIQMPIRV